MAANCQPFSFRVDSRALLRDLRSYSRATAALHAVGLGGRGRTSRRNNLSLHHADADNSNAMDVVNFRHTQHSRRTRESVATLASTDHNNQIHSTRLEQ